MAKTTELFENDRDPKFDYRKCGYCRKYILGTGYYFFDHIDKCELRCVKKYWKRLKGE